MELFNQLICTVYSVPSIVRNYSFIDVVNPNLLLCIKTTAVEVKEILQNLDITKATGADNVPSCILKACSKELSTPLAILFNTDPCLRDPVVCSDNTIALYADDSKMFSVIDCDEDLIYFQEDLDKLHHWSQPNLMDFNTKKCKSIRITRKQEPFTNIVHMNDTILKEVKEFKNLGILTDCSLSRNSHTDMITAKANRMLGLIKRICKGLQGYSHINNLVLFPCQI